MTDTPPRQPDPARRDPAAGPLRPASPVRRTAVRAARAGVSLIWIVPFVALLVTLALAWNAYAGRGTLVSVAFSDATGIIPGETALKFREISVGKVEAVRFTSDLESVIVDIRVDKDVAEYIDDDAEFWIVRPEVSAQGISRLDTVLTGAFIEGWWDAEIGTTEIAIHPGLDKPPLTRGRQRGTWFTLAADNAKGMSEGAPIFYRGLQVGQMQNLRLSDTDERVVADMFVEAPHDNLLTTASVFWDISGFGVSLGPQGVQLKVNSVASLVQGGAEFATVTSGGQPAPAGHLFTLQPDEDTARNSLFTGTGKDELRLTMLLPDAIKGLSEGADVQFQGLTVGRVSSLAVRVVPGVEGRARQVLQDVTLAISPQRLGLPEDATPADALTFLSGRVSEGLRARVTGAGFFGTTLMVELVDVPAAPAARIVADAEPYPVIPAAAPDLEDISATAQGLMARIGQLKIEELLKSATDMMNSVTAIASSQDTREIPASLRKTIDEAQATMTELRSATQDLRQAGVVENISGAADKANQLAGKLNDAADRFPDIVASVDGITTSVGQVDFAALAADARAALADIRGVIGTDAARALPSKVATAVDSLGRTADSIGTVATQLRDGDIAGRVGRAVDQAGAAADAVKLAAADVPDMVDKIDAAATSFDELDFAGLGDRLGATLDDLRALIGTDAAKALPARIATAVDRVGQAAGDIGAVAAGLNQNDLGGRVSTFVDQASAAADAVAQAAADVPEMVDKIDAAATSVDEFDFAAVSQSATGLIEDLRRMLGTKDAEELPRNLSDTLKSASALLNDLREGGAANNLNAALASARRAMDEVARAANTLPQLSGRYQQLAARAESVVASFGDRGAFNTELVNTLRSFRRAADSFGSLSNTIERNPRAFILGR